MRFLECLQFTGKILFGSICLWSVMKKSSVSRMQRCTYFPILCFVLGRWIRTQHQILIVKKNWVGSRVHHNTELWTQLTANRWNWSGISSQDSPHCSSATKSKSSVKNERRARRIYRTDHLHVDVQRHLMGISRQWTGMRIKRQSRFYLCEKIPTRTLVILRTWIRKEVVFYFQRKTTRRMGQSRWIDDDQFRRKRTPSFPSHEYICPQERQKAKEMENINALLCRWTNDWNCFSHNYFC